MVQDIKHSYHDFISLGLCLIEVLSGKEVFHDILKHETVFNKKMAGENPSIPVIKNISKKLEFE